MRDFSGEVFTVFHCLLEDIEPLGVAENIYYMGCPTCKKKMCEHKEMHIPLFLANLLLMTFDHKVQAKGIGNAIQSILQIPASDCEPDADGHHDKLHAALEVARGQPYNCKFIIGQYVQGSKNVLELVDAKPTIEVTLGSTYAHFPSSMMKLVDSEIKGTPPCCMKDLKMENDLKILFDKPVNAIQVLVTITDSGEERGCMSRDGDLVRISRKAVCALSGTPVILHRTGELLSTSKYCKWNKGDVVYVIGRAMGVEDNVWRIAMCGDRHV